MGKFGIETALAICGTLILVIGLFEKIDTQWIKIGTENKNTRISALIIGFFLIGAGFWGGFYRQPNSIKEVKELENKLKKQSEFIKSFSDDINDMRKSISNLESHKHDIPIAYRHNSSQINDLASEKKALIRVEEASKYQEEAIHTLGKQLLDQVNKFDTNFSGDKWKK